MQFVSPIPMTGNKSGNVKKIKERLQMELDLTIELCRLLESKAGFLQGRGIEKVLDEIPCVVCQ